jgi:hypothetical protein
MKKRDEFRDLQETKEFNDRYTGKVAARWKPIAYKLWQRYRYQLVQYNIMERGGGPGINPFR